MRTYFYTFDAWMKMCSYVYQYAQTSQSLGSNYVAQQELLETLSEIVTRKNLEYLKNIAPKQGTVWDAE